MLSACRASAVDLLALVVVLVASALPDRPGGSIALALITVPIELVLGGATLLLLPARPRAVLSTMFGVLLGLLTVLKVADLAFYTALARPFDPVLDVSLLDDAMRLLTSTHGPWGALAIRVGVVSALLAVIVVTTVAVRRLAGTVVRRRAAATRAVTVIALGWMTIWLAGVQLAPDLPVAGSAETRLAAAKTMEVASGLADRHRFEREAADDSFANVSSAQLLTALRGKDVVIAFVESYGRSALADPRLSSDVDSVLDHGTADLAAAGLESRSAFLTSPTAGGGSWLAHGTLLSGLWIDNQSRYRQLVGSDRLTLPRAFAAAGWRTVAVAPGTTRAWPEASFYGYQCVYDDARLGYRGPSFSWAAMPDQYTLATFQRRERSAPHAPVMAVVPLVSSHAPWAPVPRMIQWSDAEDSWRYASMAGPNDPPEVILTRDRDQVRADYARAIGYSLQAIISYVHRYGDHKLVMIMVGDHQPSPVVTGDDAGRDVPITIVAKDPAVISRTAGWGWSPGLRPADGAPVWRMDAFRSRFLATFGG